MGIEKIEKKLPEEILSIIDEESANNAISRQEAISRLIQSVSGMKQESENERLRYQVKDLVRQIEMKDDEISYLRRELSNLNQGLSKLAETIVRNHADQNEIQSVLTPIRQDMILYAEDIRKMKEIIQGSEKNPYEKYIPLIIIGMLAGLLILYLIVSKISP